MFYGSHTVKVDDKSRIFIPSQYRDKLLSVCGGSLNIFLDLQEPCLSIVTRRKWEEIENLLIERSNASGKYKQIRRLISGTNRTCEMTRAGRISISKDLRGEVEIGKEARLIGCIDQFELWNPEKYAEHRKQIQILNSDPDRQEYLEGFGF